MRNGISRYAAEGHSEAPKCDLLACDNAGTSGGMIEGQADGVDDDEPAVAVNRREEWVVKEKGKADCIVEP